MKIYWCLWINDYIFESPFQGSLTGNWHYYVKYTSNGDPWFTTSHDADLEFICEVN